jgi:hypothetical protein
MILDVRVDLRYPVEIAGYDLANRQCAGVVPALDPSYPGVFEAVAVAGGHRERLDIVGRIRRRCEGRRTC